jgi:hypothetical protein
MLPRFNKGGNLWLGNPYWRGSIVKLTLYKLVNFGCFLIWFFCKTSYLNEVVNGTKPSPFVILLRICWPDDDEVNFAKRKRTNITKKVNLTFFSFQIFCFVWTRCSFGEARTFQGSRLRLELSRSRISRRWCFPFSDGTCASTWTGSSWTRPEKSDPRFRKRCNFPDWAKHDWNCENVTPFS